MWFCMLNIAILFTKVAWIILSFRNLNNRLSKYIFFKISYRQHEKFQPSKVFISSLDQNPNKLKICVTKLIKNKRKFLFLTYKIKALSGRN